MFVAPASGGLLLGAGPRAWCSQSGQQVPLMFQWLRAGPLPFQQCQQLILFRRARPAEGECSLRPRFWVPWREMEEMSGRRHWVFIPICWKMLPVRCRQTSVAVDLPPPEQQSQVPVSPWWAGASRWGCFHKCHFALGVLWLVPLPL